MVIPCCGLEIDSILDTIMDDFECEYAVQWLTNLLRVLPMADASHHAFNDGVDERLEGILNRAAGLLAFSSGPSASSSVSQSYRLPTRTQPAGKDGAPPSPSSTLVEITIKEGSINSCDFPGAVGMQTWGSAMVLANCIADDPGLFIPLKASGSSTNQLQGPLRVLELGAGTGFVSIAMAKIASQHIQHRIASTNSPNDPKVEVFATDYDEIVLSNLHENLCRNGPYGCGVLVTSQALDWEYYYRLSTCCDGNEQGEMPLTTVPEGGDDLLHSFDVILATDVVYEMHQAEWLRATVQSLLRRPEHDPNLPPSQLTGSPLFHLVVPIRQTHSAELESITRIFAPFEMPTANHCRYTSDYRLAILRSLQIGGEEGNGFIRYEIGWVLK